MYSVIIICIKGGDDENENERSEIFSWSEESMEWEQVWKMNVGRANHAITTISAKEVAAICG